MKTYKVTVMIMGETISDVIERIEDLGQELIDDFDEESIEEIDDEEE